MTTKTQRGIKNLIAAMAMEAAFQQATNEGFSDFPAAYKTARNYFVLSGKLCWKAGMMRSKAQAELHRAKRGQA